MLSTAPIKASLAPRRLLLVDGDVLAFIAAAAVQGKLTDEAGWVTPIANEGEGEVAMRNMIYSLQQGLKGECIAIYISDPKSNWRHSVDPSYKSNRTGDKPLLLDFLKQYLVKTYGATFWPGLEADDVLGIQMTDPNDHGMERVMVGRDKDFASIPGLHHQIKKDVDAKGKPVTRTVTQWQADRFHLIQALAGDAVDGYPGCPNVGMVRAAEVIDTPMRLTPTEGVVTRGPNKGNTVVRWIGEPTQDHWVAIVSQYRKALGLGYAEAEEIALVQARLARILRYGEYNRDTEEVTLWTPAHLHRSTSL
jgi:5'-3' exonuclease